MNANTPPLVTIIMPIRNEARYIERSLGAVLAQDYPPERLEVLAVDGMSDDGTRTLVQTLMERAGQARRSPSLTLLNNPARIVPAALNIGLRHVHGDVIIRVDGHCEIAADYVRQCVQRLAETNADCVGGPIQTVGTTYVAKAIALAMSTPFGVGNAAFRMASAQEGYVDTLAFGAYRREVFDRSGAFDEEFVNNQDDEFNFRLTQSGGRILMTPAIHSTYYSRAGLRGLWRQYFNYGSWKVLLVKKRGGLPSWRLLIPPAFVAGLAASLGLALGTGQPAWLLAVAAPYVVANLAASVWAASRRGWQYLPVLALAFAVLHLSYGVGFWAGLWRFNVARRPGHGESPKTAPAR